MSTSRSSTPTRKPAGPSTNIATINDPTTVSAQPHDTIATHNTISSRTAPSVIASTTPRAPSPRSSPKRGVVRKADDDLEEPTMAKRQRRVSLESQPRHHEDSRSSPSSDSQSGMGDTEVDQKKAGQSATSMGSTTQKKKRTRTLTTPHQAAVLHALLAQSRFPTTAMREEVGRAIGLSARKVQIWFQNQRQKARRPKSQGDAPTSRSPQYGSYSAGLHSPAMGTYPMPTHPRMLMNAPYNVAGPSTLRSPEAPPRHEQTRSSSMTGAPLPVMPTEGELLLGPGMPGTQMSRHRPSRSHGRELPPLAPPLDAYGHPAHGPRYMSPSSSTASPPIHPSLMLRPVQLDHRRDWDLSRTLPPLTQSRPSTSSQHRYHGPRPYSLRMDSPPPVMSLLQHRRSHSPDRRFAHQLPDPYAGAIPTSAPLSHPPPYTLQPAHYWNPALDTLSSSEHWPRPASLSAGNPPPSLVASHVGGTSRRRPDDHGSGAHVRQARVVSDRELGMPRPLSPPPGLGGMRADSSPPSPPRSGRYDPIREVFVPFTPSVAPPTSAPTPPDQGHENVEDSSSDEDQ